MARVSSGGTATDRWSWCTAAARKSTQRSRNPSIPKHQVDGLRVTDEATLQGRGRGAGGNDQHAVWWLRSTRLAAARWGSPARMLASRNQSRTAASRTNGELVDLGLVGEPASSGDAPLDRRALRRGFVPVVACIGASRRRAAVQRERGHARGQSRGTAAGRATDRRRHDARVCSTATGDDGCTRPTQHRGVGELGNGDGRHGRETARVPRRARRWRERSGDRGRTRARTLADSAYTGRAPHDRSMDATTHDDLTAHRSRPSRPSTSCRPTNGRRSCSFAVRAAPLFDAAGRSYLDFISGIGVVVLGHAHAGLAAVDCGTGGDADSDLEPLLPPAARAARGTSRGAVRAAAGLLLQQRHRGRRGVPQVRATLLVLAGQQAPHRLCGPPARVLRPNAGRAVGDGQPRTTANRSNR